MHKYFTFVWRYEQNMNNKIALLACIALAGILTLTVLASISSNNQAFAQAKKPTSLSIGTYPCCERKTSLPTARASFSGKLFTEGTEGPGGATIHLIGVPGFWFDKTNEFGSYSVMVDLGPGTYHIHTHYGGDSDHEASDSRTITYTVTH
jgi:hypothetical protein